MLSLISKRFSLLPVFIRNEPYGRRRKEPFLPFFNDKSSNQGFISSKREGIGLKGA